METLIAGDDGDDRDRINEQFAQIEEQLRGDFVQKPYESRPGDIHIRTLGKHSGRLVLSRSNVHLRAFQPAFDERFYN